MANSIYCGRIAPTPSGWLHLGHASTFGMAWRRARDPGGRILYRTEDLDPARCRERFASAAKEDLRWWGLDWDGEEVIQSERLPIYQDALQKLIEAGLVYPSPHSRKEIQEQQPEKSPIDGEFIFPPQLRAESCESRPQFTGGEMNFRFRVPDGREISFTDNRTGVHSFVAGRDFGDFIIWKKDGYPAYELAVVVDDHAMGITEVVRGEDLLVSTARQLLIYEALGWESPGWYHCSLVNDPATGKRMSKTHDSLSIGELRRAGLPPGRDADFYLSALKK